MKNRVIAFFFLTILVSFLTASLLLRPRQYSAMENRYLKQAPKLTLSSIKDGAYMDEVEEYMADQIAGKDLFIVAKTTMEKWMNKKESGGVYFGKNGRYIKKYEPDEETLQKNIQFVDAFAKEIKGQTRVTFLLAPNVQSIYPEELPSHVVMPSAKKDREKVENGIKNAKLVDPTSLLTAHKEEYIYFKTDHHWTMRGAYYGYKALLKAWNETPHPLSFYEESSKSDSFLGSLYSKAPLSIKKKDSIEVFTNLFGAYRVTFEDGSHINSLFVPSRLYTKDKYTYFLDGNHPFLTIRSNAGTGKKALVLKDSYSHALLPFLADHYDTIEVCDLRYYKEDLKKKIKDEGYDDVILLYNMDFFSTDDNFIWLK